MATQPISAVDGIGYDDPLTLPKNPGLNSGRVLKWLGQAGNTSGGNTANQQVGTFNIPQATASAATIVVNNTKVTATSLIFCQVKGAGGVIVDVQVTSLSAGVSFTVTVYTSGALTAAVDVHYLIIN